ncbi:glycoside hydrolase family 32 protein [Deminuibacter soli]|uniref:Glycoside hydrolase family 32 protein n=1 Tax=Deminuibacter soli TaxID=2291815 RepID=A0A3E1NFM9_9BACT|nr:glycoside hydrolase family 32 protein [Deminuibacter soli]RFM26769.1 glycoside hydrolase family 32 protein [Deminuibacter soli]
MKKLLLYCSAWFSCFTLAAQSDTQPTPQWRPVYHFTPAKNWTNDPNGLIYFNGEYHLYNQQNPFENKWGHMSWGHATSKDLLSFKHLPVAIPETIDRDTNWRFSGCVVYDKNNTSGFGKNGAPLVAIYTVAQPNKHLQTQWVAYSNDGGNNYTNYENNPVLNLNKEDFRDPNVRWNEQLKKWVMVVAMPAEHAVRFYSSPNLKDWTLLSEFGNNKEGFHERAWECPFLVQLPVDGNEHNKKWVLFVSSWGSHEGPFMQYFTGDFDGTRFINDNPGTAYLTVDEGNTFYAAIPFNNQPQGREILVGWMVPLKQPTYPWRGQFSIPRDLSLRTTGEGLRLVQQPSAVVTAALAKLPAAKKQVSNNLFINNGSVNLTKGNSFSSNALWIQATFTPGTAKTVGFRLTQNGDSATTVTYTTETGELSIVPVNGEEIHPLKATVKPQNGKLTLEILLDKSTLEVFANNGEKVFTTLVFPGQQAKGLSAFATGGAAKLDVKLFDLDK